MKPRRRFLPRRRSEQSLVILLFLTLAFIAAASGDVESAKTLIKGALAVLL